MTTPTDGIQVQNFPPVENLVGGNEILSAQEARRQENLAKCPIPYCLIAGSTALIYPDVSDKKKGLIIVPDSSQKPTMVGTIVQVGGGFASDYDYKPEDFRGNCPYKPGDRVVWGKYDAGSVLACYVQREWWSEDQIAEMKQFKREYQVEFMIVELGRIKALSTAGEREPIVPEG